MEKWEKIKGYPNYEISSLGRINNINRNKLLNPSKNTWGYPGVHLYKDGISKRFQIHRLVAESFIDNPEEKKEVNHIDGDKTNNKASNLEWVTRSENMKHANLNKLIDMKKAYEKSPRTKGKTININDKRNGINYTFSSAAKAARHFGYVEGYFNSLINRYGGENGKFKASYANS